MQRVKLQHRQVKQAMKINYFDDEELIRVQSEKYQGV